MKIATKSSIILPRFTICNRALKAPIEPHPTHTITDIQQLQVLLDNYVLSQSEKEFYIETSAQFGIANIAQHVFENESLRDLKAEENFHAMNLEDRLLCTDLLNDYDKALNEYHCAITPEQQSIAEAQFDKTILALAAQLQIHDFLPDADKAKILERVEAIKAQELLKTQERETEQELNQQTQKSWDMSL